MLTKENIDYTQYTLEDFLQDQNFISTITQEDEYWLNYEKSNPENLDEFLKAKYFIHSTNTTKDVLSEIEVENLWDEIENENKKSTSRKIKVKFTIYAIVAASLLALFLCLPNIGEEKDDLYSFVESANKIDYSTLKKTQLILSEEKNISLEEKDAVVIYDSLAIKTASNDIAKTESAAYNQMVVPVGRRSQVVLSDGSKIWINSGTRIIYPVEFKKEQREIYVDGEIYIKVTPNSNQPFVVKTRDMQIKVLGTEFNVNAYENKDTQSVVLASGSVQIDNNKNNHKVKLVPNNMYRLNGEEQHILNVDVKKYIAWMDGIYIYENEKLGYILDFLGNYYNSKIECSDDLRKISCSGKLEMTESLDPLLERLKFIAPISYEKQGGIYKIKQNK